MNSFVLDCTFRDGGYYNSWDFSAEIVDAYLEAIAESKVDFVELGFRNFAQPGFFGAFAYTTDEFLNSLKLPEGPVYGVMIDAKIILESRLSTRDAISALFNKRTESKIGLVRIAAHFSEAARCKEMIDVLKEYGYQVGFNLMQAGGKPSELIVACAEEISSWRNVDVLYFADSLGNMDRTEVERVYESIVKGWSGPVGIHAHNNMSRALDNTLFANELGVTWLDSTITGMGRGAGNAQTERLLTVLNATNKDYSLNSVYALVIRHFELMQKQYGWGSNLLYFIGATNDVHPTYIQNLLSSTHFGTEELVGALDYLSRLEDASSYKGELLTSAVEMGGAKPQISGSDDVAGLFDGKNVLLVTNAPSVKNYSCAIEKYICKVDPVVIAINSNVPINEHLIDYYIISHNSKYLSQSESYLNIKKPIILPKCRFSSSELDVMSDLEIIDYGLMLEEGCLVSKNRFAKIPHDITVAYALALLMRSRIKTISVVGFDGYSESDVRQQEMVEILTLYSASTGSVEITALTPTTYPIKKSSIYAPVS